MRKGKKEIEKGEKVRKGGKRKEGKGKEDIHLVRQKKGEGEGRER